LIYKKFFSRLIDAIDEARHKQTLTFDSLILNTAEVDTLPRPKLSAEQARADALLEDYKNKKLT
jgi:hypothetical protein